MTVAIPRSATPLLEQLRLRRRALLAAGAVMVLLGLLTPIYPGATSVIVGFAAGWVLWLAGAVMVGVSLLMLPRWLMLTGLAAALAATLAGVFLTFNPTTGALALAILLAAVFVMDGGFQLALALRLRPFAVWRWVLVSAFASLLAAVLFAMGFPDRSPPVIAALLSVALVTTGLGLVALGLIKPGPAPR
jgi:uncharacterized membrane protein HdeD (DUF308 family)